MDEAAIYREFVATLNANAGEGFALTKDELRKAIADAVKGVKIDKRLTADQSARLAAIIEAQRNPPAPVEAEPQVDVLADLADVKRRLAVLEGARR